MEENDLGYEDTPQKEPSSGRREEPFAMSPMLFSKSTVIKVIYTHIHHFGGSGIELMENLQQLQGLLGSNLSNESNLMLGCHWRRWA